MSTSHTSTSFQQKFTLNQSIDTSSMTANLISGVLEVYVSRTYSHQDKTISSQFQHAGRGAGRNRSI